MLYCGFAYLRQYAVEKHLQKQTKHKSADKIFLTVEPHIIFLILLVVGSCSMTTKRLW